MNSIIRTLIVILLIVLVLFVGFISGMLYIRSNLELNHTPLVMSATASQFPTRTNTPSIQNKIPIPSRTNSQNVTETSTVIPTTSPTPTIDYFFNWDFYTNLLIDNLDCVFPCWLGLQTGVSTFQDVQILFDSMKIFRESYRLRNDSIGGFWWITDGTSPLFARFLVGSYFDKENDSLEWLTISTDIYEEDKDIIFGSTTYELIFHRYLLSEILTQVGIPSEVWLWVHPKVYNTMDLLLYYPDLGMVVKIETFIRMENSYFQGCPQLGKTTLFLWDTEKDYDLQKAVNRESQGNFHFYYSEDRPEGYMPLETATDMSILDFYTVYREEENKQCIESDVSLWPGP